VVVFAAVAQLVERLFRNQQAGGSFPPRSFMIEVVNYHTYAGPGINIRRPNILGNPFVIGKDGTREEVIEKYRVWLWQVMQNQNSDVFKEINRITQLYLAGEHVVLICCCEPDNCHGRVIKWVIEWRAEQITHSEWD
jgi:hypothetical protein